MLKHAAVKTSFLVAEVLESEVVELVNCDFNAHFDRPAFDLLPFRANVDEQLFLVAFDERYFQVRNRPFDFLFLVLLKSPSRKVT